MAVLLAANIKIKSRIWSFLNGDLKPSAILKIFSENGCTLHSFWSNHEEKKEQKVSDEFPSLLAL